MTGSVRFSAYIKVNRAAAALISGGGTAHGKQGFDHCIVVIPAARDRLHGGGVEPPVDDEAVVDMDANDLAEYYVATGRIALDIVE